MSEKIAQLKVWLNNLIYPGKYDDFVEVIEYYKNDEQEDLRICFYTEEHQYIIRARDVKNEDGYLACGVVCRKARPGEDWIRGNDLPDGPFNEDTWNNILKGIIRYEMVKLSEYRKPNNQPEEAKEE